MSLINASEESGAPTTPTAGRQVIYPKSGGWFVINAAGTEKQIAFTTDTVAASSAVVVADTADGSCFVGLFEAATGTLQPKTDGGLTYNASTGVLTATGFAGSLTGSVTGNASTATTLATPRAIYGNNFDGSAALNQVIASTYGGTGNGFTKFSGPTTTEKTFTLPDASSTLEVQSNKDASGGYAGLTGFALNLKNAAGTFVSFLSNTATAARSWVMPDKDGTVAMLSDISSVTTASGSEFYFDNTVIIPAGTGPQTVPVETLSTTPSIGVEEIQSVSVTNETLMLADAYMDGPIGSTSIPAGQWEFHSFRYVSATGGTSEIITSIYTNHTETGTITITGTGTSRTATVTGGTPFLAGDANASMELCSWIQTPNAQFRITAYTSSSIVTIECLSTYTNESGVAFSKDTYRFDKSTGDIQDTTVTEQIYAYFLSSPITVSATDKVVSRMFAKTDSLSAKTIYFVYGGTTHYSHFHATVTMRHSGLANLDYASSGHTGFQPAITFGTGVQTALGVNLGSAGAVEINSNKDASGGYAGLTGFALNLKNAAGTFTSLLSNTATAARAWAFPDKDGTIALTNDKLSAFSATSSAELAGVISDETGSGSLVFNTDATLNRLIIGSSTWSARPAAATYPNANIRITDIGTPGTGSLWTSDGTRWRPLNGEVTLLCSGIPVMLQPSGTVGDNGALSALATALPIAFPHCYQYYPAGAIHAGSAAGHYYMQMSSTTTGTIFQEMYTGGVPVIPASPTPFVCVGPGAYTQTINTHIALHSVTVPGWAMGPNGQIMMTQAWSYANSANSKIVRGYLGATNYFNSGALTATNTFKTINVISNSGSETAQLYQINSYPAAIATAIVSSAIDTTADTTASVTGYIANASDFVISYSTIIKLVTP